MLTWIWLMSAVIAVSCASVHDAVSHTVPKKSNVCTGGGYDYDPDDCQVFYKCIYSNKLGSYIPVKTICSPGTVFSKNHHNTCVSPKKSGRPECEHSRPSSIYSLRVKNGDSPEGPEASVATKNDSIVCKKQGFLEDAEDCTKFYLCVVSGINIFKKYDYFCPPSTVWESQRRWCVVSWATSREECKTHDAPPETDESGGPAELPFLPPPIFDEEDKPEVPKPEPDSQVTPVPEPEKPSDDQSSAASEHAPPQHPSVPPPEQGNESGVEQPAEQAPEVEPANGQTEVPERENEADKHDPEAPEHVPPQHPSVLPPEQGNESGVEQPAEQAPEVESANGQTEVPERENESDKHDPEAPEHGTEATSEQTVVPEHDNAPGDQQPEVPEQGNESGESQVATSTPQSESGDEQPGQGSESDEKQPEVTEPGSEAGEHESNVTPMEGSESGEQQHPDEAPVQKDESDDQNPAAPGHGSGEHHPDEASAPAGDLGDQNPGAPGHESESEQHHPDEAPVHKDESGGEHPEASGQEHDSGDQHSGVPDDVPESGDQDGQVPAHNAAGDQHPAVPERENESGDQQPEVPEHGDGSQVHPSVSVQENESGDEHSQVPEHENVSGDQQPEVPERENESGDEQRPESPVHKDESSDQQSGASEHEKVDSEDQEPSEQKPTVPEDGSGSHEEKPVVVPEGENKSDEGTSTVPPEHGNASNDDESVLGHPVEMKPPTKCPGGPTNTVSTHCPIGQLTGNQVALVCPTGFRRHPRFCNLFYQCTSSSEYDYKVAVLSCPGTTCFDNGKMQCLPADQLSDPCGGVYAGTALYRTLARNSLSPVNVPGHRLCPGVGQYPYEDGCSNLFYKCVANADNTIDGYVYECPQGYMYWAAAGRCVEANRFDCSK